MPQDKHFLQAGAAGWGVRHSRACGMVARDFASANPEYDRKGSQMYDLHYWPTPNGKKVTILLEELGAQYKIVPCNIGRGDQFSDDFLKMNPNHRMPVLVDHEPVGGGLIAVLNKPS